MIVTSENFSRVPEDLDLPASHPLGPRKGYQCNKCKGIFFPEISPPTECPYEEYGDCPKEEA